MGLIPELGRSPGVGNINPLQYSCLETHGQRSLVGYSPWGCKQSDMTENIAHTCFTLLCEFLLCHELNQLYVYTYRLPFEPPSHASVPPLQIITGPQTELPLLHTSFPLAICFTHGSVYMSIPISQFIPSCPSTLVYTSVLYICVSLPALQIGASVPLSQIPHMC